MMADIITEEQEELNRIKAEAANANSIPALRVLVADLAAELKRIKNLLNL